MKLQHQHINYKKSTKKKFLNSQLINLKTKYNPQ